MIKPFVAHNHYWHVTSRAEKWSSLRRAYVSEDDATYLKWKAEGGETTAAQTEESVIEALRLTPSLAPGYVPQCVPLWKAREQMRRAGLFDKVDAALQAFGGAPLAAWEYAQDVRRDSNLMDQFALVLGLTDKQIDALFVAANEIEV